MTHKLYKIEGGVICGAAEHSTSLRIVAMMDELQRIMQEKLPETRKKAFFFYYRRNIKTFLKLAWRCAALLIPSIIALWIRESYFDSLLQSLSVVTEEGIQAVRNSTNAQFGIIDNIALIPFLVFLPGMLRVIRQVFWNEPLIFKWDYHKGIRQNAGRFLLAALPICVIDAFLKWVVPSTPTLVLRAVWLVLLLPICIWFLLQAVYYQLGIWTGFRNAVILYIRTWPVTLAFLAVTALPFYILSEVAYLQIYKYIALLTLGFVYVIPIATIWMLYASAVFDKYINKKNYPDFYRKGMQR